MAIDNESDESKGGEVETVAKTGATRGAPSELLHDAIRSACTRRFGVLDTQFLCRSVGSVQRRAALIFAADCRVSEVLQALRQGKRGSVLLVDASGTLQGIFTERDFIRRLADCYQEHAAAAISAFMTADPVVIQPEDTIAYALNLMSQGGFRHLPVVNQQGVPEGVLSVKDIVDHIVESLMQDLLQFEPDNSL